MKKYTDVDSDLRQRLRIALFGGGKFTSIDIKQIEKLHPPLDSQQHTRIKVNFRMCLVVI